MTIYAGRRGVLAGGGKLRCMCMSSASGPRPCVLEREGQEQGQRDHASADQCGIDLRAAVHQLASRGSRSVVTSTRFLSGIPLRLCSSSR